VAASPFHARAFAEADITIGGGVMVRSFIDKPFTRKKVPDTFNCLELQRKKPDPFGLSREPLNQKPEACFEAYKVKA
jgi:hypothetical protein